MVSTVFHNDDALAYMYVYGLVIHGSFVKISECKNQRLPHSYYYNSSLEGATKLKSVPFCSPWDVLLHGILFRLGQNFQILAKNHGL